MKQKFLTYKLLLAVAALTQLPALADNFTLMTYNIRRQGNESKSSRIWHRRLPHVAAVINQQQPAILGLQEAVLEQIDNLTIACPGYSWVGSGRGSTWFGMAKDEHVPLLYKRTDFTLLEHGTFHINNHSLVKRKKEGLIPRICTWALFKENNSDKTFYVYNIHLDNDYPKARIKGLQNVIADIQKRVPANIPVFLIGDFNTNIVPKIATVLQQAGFKDTKGMAEVTQAATKTHTSWGSGKSSYIDHIFVKTGTAPIVVKKHEVVQQTTAIEPSDHNPVKVEVKI